MTTETKRTFEPNRYSKANALFMDMAKGAFRNSYAVHDRGKPTGISVVVSGNRTGTRTSIIFDEKEWPSLREAIFAYEDSRLEALDAE